MTSGRSTIANGRVIRTPSRPAIRASVLVVSTNEMKANRLRAVLLRGHFSASVAGPDEAIALVDDREPPNTVVLDMSDPTFDGLAVCRALRALDAPFAVLMLDPDGSLDDLLDGYEAGTDAYLTGHVEHAELFERIEELSWPQSVSA